MKIADRSSRWIDFKYAIVEVTFFKLGEAAALAWRL
jgi:hypothetical protein